MVTAELIQQGLARARRASTLKYDEIGGDKYACGFAWTEVYVERTNSREAKELIKAGFRKSYKPRCLDYWNPGDLPVQNIDIKEAGAEEFARYLTTLGLKAYAGSRLD